MGSDLFNKIKKLKFFMGIFPGEKLLIFFTSSMASKGPFAGGGITSGILLTISGLMKFVLSGREYFAVLATP